jgi:hypothetical protein
MPVFLLPSGEKLRILHKTAITRLAIASRVIAVVKTSVTGGLFSISHAPQAEDGTADGDSAEQGERAGFWHCRRACAERQRIRT